MAVLLAHSACETVVDVDLPPFKPSLVANSLFNPDSAWTVSLFKSRSRLDTSPYPAVTNATVQIMNGGDMVASLTHVGEGFYRAPVDNTPQVGEVYSLKASAPGFEEIQAFGFVPSPVSISSVDIDINRYPYEFSVDFSDPVGTKNYYQIMAFSPNQPEGGRLIPLWLESDDLIFQDLGGIDGRRALFEDSFISGKSYSLKIRAYPLDSDPMRQIYVVLQSVSEAYFNYKKTADSQLNNGDNPFSTPVQVFNNIENGLGIFAGYSQSKYPVFQVLEGNAE